jgi:hypothetical protein
MARRLRSGAVVAAIGGPCVSLALAQNRPNFSLVMRGSRSPSPQTTLLLLFGLHVAVSMEFAASGEPRGWQRIDVKTREFQL